MIPKYCFKTGKAIQDPAICIHCKRLCRHADIHKANASKILGNLASKTAFLAAPTQIRLIKHLAKEEGIELHFNEAGYYIEVIPKESVWDILRHFNPREKWGDSKRMNPLLLIILDKLRNQYGKPFIVHCGYATSGHVKHSYHYTGDACDFHIKSRLHFRAQISILLRQLHNISLSVYPAETNISVSALCGLGIYPEWNPPGFHLDVRGYPARWGAFNKKYHTWEETMKYIAEKEEKLNEEK